MRTVFAAAAILAITAPVAAVYAEAAPKFSSSASKINDLLANPDAKAVLVKHIPQIAEAGAMVGDRTLKQVQTMAPDRLTDKLLADIDVDLAKIK